MIIKSNRTSHPLGPPEGSRVPMVSPVLGQAMRMPEQLPALEETKAGGLIPRMSRATMSALKAFLVHSTAEELKYKRHQPVLLVTTCHKANCLQFSQRSGKGSEVFPNNLCCFFIAQDTQPTISNLRCWHSKPVSLADLANRQQCFPISQLWPQAG